ncbi:NADPH-dependent FMN reductase [Candidatus Pantoea formicae]|jgi:chromate reductase, NAD(P)H dehydrogenase (quinone)|uniref:NADPH-dependent FMN reductase n=1 Tax=Candidatus Pantoea formicae TaxID=2608355 RepID=UPI003ED9862E
MKKPFKILGVSGSLRKASVNTTFLRAMQCLCPEGYSLDIYPGLHEIPLFNPDVDETVAPSQSVLFWRTSLLRADMVLLASPEYAHGVTGVMKNALDWIVSSGELTDKPLAFPNLSVRTDLAWQQLAETLKVMGGQLIQECSPHASLSKPLVLPDISEQTLLENRAVAERLQQLWANIIAHLQATTVKP